MSQSLTEQLLSQLQGAPVEQVSRQLGISPAQANGAIGAALPLLMGALGRNAAQPQGADALFGALQRDHSGLDLGNVLDAVMGGGNTPEANGVGILGHIFGSSQPRAEAGLAQATGLGDDRAGQLMKILAPIVLAFIAQRMGQSGQGNSAALGQMLGQEQQRVREQGGVGGGLLGAVLDQDGDGQLGLGDLLKVGSSLFSGNR